MRYDFFFFFFLFFLGGGDLMGSKALRSGHYGKHGNLGYYLTCWLQDTGGPCTLYKVYGD